MGNIIKDSDKTMAKGFTGLLTKDYYEVTGTQKGLVKDKVTGKFVKSDVVVLYPVTKEVVVMYISDIPTKVVYGSYDRVTEETNLVIDEFDNFIKSHIEKDDVVEGGD